MSVFKGDKAYNGQVSIKEIVHNKLFRTFLRVVNPNL
jgi:hypothetical protein